MGPHNPDLLTPGSPRCVHHERMFVQVLISTVSTRHLGGSCCLRNKSTECSGDWSPQPSCVCSSPLNLYVASPYHFFTAASLQQTQPHPHLPGVHRSWPHLQPSWQPLFLLASGLHHNPPSSLHPLGYLFRGNFARRQLSRSFYPMREAHVCSLTA